MRRWIHPPTSLSQGCPDADAIDSLTLDTTLAASKGEPTPSRAKTTYPPVVQVTPLRFSTSAFKDRSCWAEPWR